ncbi:MAG: hypothetical protein ACK518_02995, partial [bacterium]
KLGKIGCGMIGMERCLKMYASTGNRTRAARVAGEHSTIFFFFLQPERSQNFLSRDRFFFPKSRWNVG